MKGLKFFKADNFSTLADIKNQYRNLMMENHPDHGGNDEIAKEINAEYEFILEHMLDHAFESYQADRQSRGQDPFDVNLNPFYEILKTIMEMEGLDIQIIGYWIYAFKSFQHKDELAKLGFWFSKKHRAWVFSGRKKSRFHTNMTLDQIKDVHGVEYVNSKKKGFDSRIAIEERTA